MLADSLREPDPAAKQGSGLCRFGACPSATCGSGLNNAKREELISRNVVALVTLPAMRKPKRKSWTSEEARRFLESAKNDNDPLYAAYLLVLLMALRKGELLGLGLESILSDTSELDISWQLQRVQRKLVRRRVKTDDSEATLPLIDLVMAALKHRIERRDRAKADAWLENGLLFTTEHGTPVDRTTSTAPGTHALPRRVAPGSPCTMDDVPARPCWPTWTSIPAPPCASCAMPSSP